MSYFYSNEIFYLYEEMTKLRLLIAYTCMEEMFMSGKINK